ncbi:MAG: extracellular solute-binding protein [Armatimonadetes bacterium]|nr:extracellular solute-binding protein [Armatimonadota bacterium]
MKRSLAVLLVCLLALAGCRAFWEDDEEKVVVYTPFPETTARELARAFEEDTGIEVQQVLEGTTKVFARLRAEKNYPRADVWYGGGGMIPFIAATRDGLLEPYKPAGWETMPEKRGNLILRDAEWHWVGMSVIALGYAYNPQITAEQELPASWDDLADPRWKGHIEMWDPASSGTAMLLLDAALLRYIHSGQGEEKGWEYLTELYKNLKPYTVEGKPAFSVARGHTKIAIHFEHQVLEFLEEQSGGEARVEGTLENIRWMLPPDSPVIVDPIALVKGAPHPENAKKFIDFIMSPRGQKIVNRFFFSIDPSLPPPPGLGDVTLKDLEQKAQELDPVWMAEQYDAIRKRWQNEVEATSKD